MNKSKKQGADSQQIDPSRWMVTFSDLVMLLLTFFVMLLTMSSMDQKKLKDLVMHLREAVGVLELSGSRGITDLASFIKEYDRTETSYVIDHRLLTDLFIPLVKPGEDIEQRLKHLSELIDISDDERGIVFSFQEKILFDSGEARIKREAFPVLDIMAAAIDSCANDILIMGHTDNIPIHSELFTSNWELSVYRGLSVLEYFLKQKGLQPSRFSVGGYGSTRPIRPNDTPKNRARNRRVEIIFKHLQGV
ncbi:MAG: OmpA family protein [Deltaproteobacteria bacterium]|nr:OmpA family protein [Deltaproteobacteria bacterium]MBW2338807.1 OmpA family protein [Deltaproteobacteria bacterium]